MSFRELSIHREIDENIEVFAQMEQLVSSLCAEICK